VHFASIYNDDQDMEEQRINKENQDKNIRDDDTPRAVNVYPGSRLTEGWYLKGS